MFAVCSASGQLSLINGEFKLDNKERQDNSFKTSVYFMPWFVTYPQELEGLRAGSGLKKTVLRASSTYRNELADN